MLFYVTIFKKHFPNLRFNFMSMRRCSTHLQFSSICSFFSQRRRIAYGLKISKI